MSDAIIERSNLEVFARCYDLIRVFLVDEMGGRIDDLEKSIADLMTQAGFDENEAKKEAEDIQQKAKSQAQGGDNTPATPAAGGK